MFAVLFWDVRSVLILPDLISVKRHKAQSLMIYMMFVKSADTSQTSDTKQTGFGLMIKSTLIPKAERFCWCFLSISKHTSDEMNLCY